MQSKTKGVRTLTGEEHTEVLAQEICVGHQAPSHPGAAPHTVASGLGWGPMEPIRSQGRESSISFLVVMGPAEPRETRRSMKEPPVVEFCMFKHSPSYAGEVTFRANFLPLFGYEHIPNPAD